MSNPDFSAADDAALDFAANLGATANLSRDETADPALRAMAQGAGENVRYDQDGQVPG
ncbi:hypothetical protein [Kitasatospora purpeofusca]|uniref:hypothetical protein n=1 Tax=Kitasatospora purpeofusca TaxID=67352 RepID=UPI0038685085|nr:hypothetical protein OIP63_16485 [Kitasatospora purpeofusca]